MYCVVNVWYNVNKWRLKPCQAITEAWSSVCMCVCMCVFVCLYVCLYMCTCLHVIAYVLMLYAHLFCVLHALSSVLSALALHHHPTALCQKAQTQLEIDITRRTVGTFSKYPRNLGLFSKEPYKNRILLWKCLNLSVSLSSAHELTVSVSLRIWCNGFEIVLTLQHTATWHINILQHTATWHCNILQHLCLSVFEGVVF